MKDILSKTKKYWSHISLIDKFLIGFLFILFCENVFLVFTNLPLNETDGRLETIFRTSTASLTGYFLSSNFLGNIHAKQKKPVEEATPRSTSVTERAKIQTIIAAAICFASLAVLIIVRNVESIDSTNYVASIAQFRDFFASSLGFLLGDFKSRGKA